MYFNIYLQILQYTLSFCKFLIGGDAEFFTCTRIHLQSYLLLLGVTVSAIDCLIELIFHRLQP